MSSWTLLALAQVAAPQGSAPITTEQALRT
jgi:hypothetical protein